MVTGGALAFRLVGPLGSLMKPISRRSESPFVVIADGQGQADAPSIALREVEESTEHPAAIAQILRAASTLPLETQRPGAAIAPNRGLDGRVTVSVTVNANLTGAQAPALNVFLIAACIDALLATSIVVVAFLRRYAEPAWFRVLVAVG